MKVVLINSYSTNKWASHRPAVYHRGSYYAIGSIDSYGAQPLLRQGLAVRLQAKEYSFINKNSYIQPGFTSKSEDVRVVRVLGDVESTKAEAFDHVLTRYRMRRLPVRPL